ncbi:nucleoside hydrolase [Deinococcus maricopensis]|uniref:Uridine nucleosidase n=1 Tax=Deinococcus maricopensis (strain DSM 21211 / LMG 22137 / NRRL B-23946 / LB-34) TaxID=709986 RepID=E8U6I9_DEIML|nr:nucleoside hydrolase [Deinococcus maricopensis]ADV66678.1 Uridine nucleosidase [Deinococcus maricopensis DSM 21211]
MPRSILLDCDPGHDDAIALLTALGSPDLHVLAVTVTHGNAPLERTLHNARALVELAGASTPVYAGATRPLQREPLYAPHIHGESGVGNVRLPEPVRPVASGVAAQAIVDAARAAPGEVTLVATGPLTNVALALQLAPDLPDLLAGTVIMGGGLERGNASAYAEFNFLADPHAARAVLNAGLNPTLFPLNVTHQVRVTRAREAQVRAVGTVAARTSAAFLDDYLTRLEARDVGERAALHDPCTVVSLLQPDAFGVEARRVDVVDEDVDAIGQLVERPGEPNARVALRASEDAVYAVICERLGRLA